MQANYYFYRQWQLKEIPIFIEQINFNHVLKSIKSEVFVNFIRSNYRRFMIIFNKVMFPFNISIINNYIKNTNNLNVNNA